MNGPIAIGVLIGAAGALLLYLAFIWFAGKSETHSRASISRPKGLPPKVSRTFQQLQRSVSCLFGFHRYVVDCHVPVGALMGRCAWCGKQGPWRKTP